MAAEAPFTDEHEALRESIRAFVEAELRPHAAEWEAARWFPNTVFEQLAERGWLGLKYGPDAALTRCCGRGGLTARRSGRSPRA